MKYLDVGEIIIIHDQMITIGGGRGGIADYRLVHAAAERSKATFAAKFLYPTIWLQSAALMQSLIKNHPFNDGNKRTGFFSTMRFLKINGYEMVAYKKDIIKFTLHVDTQNLILKEIAIWLRENSRKTRL